MSFTPDRSNSGEIKPFELLQSSFSEATPIYLPFLILSSPPLVLEVLQAVIPTLKIPLILINVVFLAPFLSGAGIYFVYRYLSTQTSDLGGAFGKAFEKLPNLILGLLIYLIAVVLGLCLLVVPGIYVAVRLSFLMYGIVVDDLDAISALRSSWNLVEGRWFSVFGAQLVVVLFSSLVSFVIGLIVGFIVTLIMGSKAALIMTTVGAWVGLVAGLAVSPFVANYYMKLYLRLKELAK